MRNVKIKTEFKRCCQSGGGLYLGVRIPFPNTLYVGPSDHEANSDERLPENLRSVMFCSVGLVFWQWLVVLSWQ